MTIGKKILKKEIIYAPATKVYDFEVKDAHHYIFEDGTISHNSYVPMKKMGGGCLVAGTKIQTPTGNKNIEEVKNGDIVNTLFGEKEVTKIFSFDDKEVYEITFDDGNTIKCSIDHKFLVDNKWLSVCDLLDLIKNTKTINIEIADMKGNLDVYREQIYENLFFPNGKSKVA